MSIRMFTWMKNMWFIEMVQNHFSQTPYIYLMLIYIFRIYFIDHKYNFYLYLDNLHLDIFIFHIK